MCQIHNLLYFAFSVLSEPSKRVNKPSPSHQEQGCGSWVAMGAAGKTTNHPGVFPGEEGDDSYEVYTRAKALLELRINSPLPHIP